MWFPVHIPFFPRHVLANVQEGNMMRQLMNDVGLEQVKSTPIMFDNQGTIVLVTNPTHHSHTKCIDIQHHFICKKDESGVIEMKYVPMEYMVAHVLTKAVEKPHHEALQKNMGLILFGNKQNRSVEVNDTLKAQNMR